MKDKINLALGIALGICVIVAWLFFGVINNMDMKMNKQKQVIKIYETRLIELKALNTSLQTKQKLCDKLVDYVEEVTVDMDCQRY